MPPPRPVTLAISRFKNGEEKKNNGGPFTKARVFFFRALKVLFVRMGAICGTLSWQFLTSQRRR